jgi:hypothetical protein
MVALHRSTRSAESHALNGCPSEWDTRPCLRAQQTSSEIWGSFCPRAWATPDYGLDESPRISEKDNARELAEDVRILVGLRAGGELLQK